MDESYKPLRKRSLFAFLGVRVFFFFRNGRQTAEMSMQSNRSSALTSSLLAEAPMVASPMNVSGVPTDTQRDVEMPEDEVNDKSLEESQKRPVTAEMSLQSNRRSALTSSLLAEAPMVASPMNVSGVPTDTQRDVERPEDDANDNSLEESQGTNASRNFTYNPPPTTCRKAGKKTGKARIGKGKMVRVKRKDLYHLLTESQRAYLPHTRPGMSGDYPCVGRVVRGTTNSGWIIAFDDMPQSNKEVTVNRNKISLLEEGEYEVPISPPLLDDNDYDDNDDDDDANDDDHYDDDNHKNDKNDDDNHKNDENDPTNAKKKGKGDGRVFSGNWHMGQAHGQGKEINPDGSIRHEGLWSYDRPIRQ
jgi:MORN repeat